MENRMCFDGMWMIVRRCGMLMLLLVLLAGCEKTAVPIPEATPMPTPTPVPTPTVLRVCVGTEDSTLDPTYLSEPNSADYISHIFEGLMKYGPDATDAAVNDSRPVYGLAESVRISEDGLVWRFTIRSDARWSDGQAITAADFVYAWQRLLTPTHHGETAHAVGAAQLYGILLNAEAVAKGELPPSALGVSAEGERQLAVTLEKPCPWFGKLCAMPCMVPLRRDVIEAFGGDWTNETNIVVSGGFVVTEWVHDDYMRLEPNPYYYDAARIAIDGIVWRFGAEGGAGCDFAADVSDAAATDTVTTAGTYYLYLNANAVRDWRVRAAMVLSVDRDSLAAELGQGAVPARGLVPAGISLSDGRAYTPDAAPMYTWLAGQYGEYDLSGYEGRCRLAKRLMGEALAAGTWHSSYTVYYRFNESVVNRKVAERCGEDWQRELGLKTEFVPMEVEAYRARLRTNTFDVAYLSWLPDYDDPLSFLEIMERGGAYNHSGWGDVRYNEQLRLAETNMDAAARDALLRRGDEMLFEAERFAICPLYWFGENCNVAEGVRGIGHSPVSGYSFHYAVK